MQQLSRVGAPRRQAISDDVAADRARGRRPDQGSARLDASNLDEPDLTIHVELLTDEAFYFFGKERGAGGLPTGTAGRVACLLSGGIDSPVAAHRMMKRGCAVTFVHFHSYPILSRASQEKVRELVTLLTTLAAALAALSRRVWRDSAAGGARRSRADARGRVPAADDAHCRSDCPNARRAGAGDGRRRRSGRLADARESGSGRRGCDAADLSPADRHGQGRDHGRSDQDRQLSDFDHPRPGLLHAVHAAQPDDPGPARARSRRRSRRFRSTILSPVPYARRSWRVRIPGGRIEGSRNKRCEQWTTCTVSGLNGIASILGGDVSLLEHQCKTIPKESLLSAWSRLRGPRVCAVRSLAARAGGAAVGVEYRTSRRTGYVSILPVDQGIEHSAGASFAPNPRTSTPRTSSSWRSRVAATRSRRRWACSARWRGSTRTGFPSS